MKSVSFSFPEVGDMFSVGSTHKVLTVSVSRVADPESPTGLRYLCDGLLYRADGGAGSDQPPSVQAFSCTDGAPPGWQYLGRSLQGHFTALGVV